MGFFNKPIVGIPIGTNCAALLTNLFFHSYKADTIVDLIQKMKHPLARSFDLSFRYIDDMLSLNNPIFGNFIPKEPLIKVIADTTKSISYLDLLLENIRERWKRKTYEHTLRKTR